MVISKATKEQDDVYGTLQSLEMYLCHRDYSIHFIIVVLNLHMLIFLLCKG